MNFLRRIGVIKGLALRVGRAIARQRMPWWSAYLFGAAGAIVVSLHMLLATPTRFDVFFLTGIAVAWVAMSFFWARLAKSSIKDHASMIEEYENLFDYVAGMNEVIRQSLDALVLYDREKAIELARELNAHTKKSLYDSFWRGETIEHE